MVKKNHNISSSLVLHATKTSICFKSNSFGWLNIDEMEFIFICSIIVLLTFLNLKFFTTDSGFKSCFYSG